MHIKYYFEGLDPDEEKAKRIVIDDGRVETEEYFEDDEELDDFLEDYDDLP